MMMDIADMSVSMDCSIPSEVGVLYAFSASGENGDAEEKVDAGDIVDDGEAGEVGVRFPGRLRGRRPVRIAAEVLRADLVTGASTVSSACSASSLSFSSTPCLSMRPSASVASAVIS